VRALPALYAGYAHAYYIFREHEIGQTSQTWCDNRRKVRVLHSQVPSSV